ncbi:MAG TPA: ABC transporter permease [Candidatus Aminicenantes bacterium]|nr:ABC transporter permease [Candidatus Aminicenantes bacterium]HRY64829.1 ABC transporter permease [Candidatus Aminicenantes bacterium]HRZ71742.1 ABC transporter permease [Candidatus Aminicenantes bacterium]
MKKLRRILHVAVNDLRIMVGDKAFFFWSLVFPMMFIILFGLLFKASDSAPAVAELTVVNLDEGRWGAYFLDKIKTPTIELKIVRSEPAEYSRLIVLPPDFSAGIEARRAQKLAFKKRRDASTKAAARVETRLYQAVARMLSELVLYGDGDLAKFLDGHAEFRDIVQVKTRFPEKTVTVVPSGFDHSIPGTTVQFIMMMVIIYGGITVLEDRKNGVLARMLFSPLSKAEVFQAKLLGRWLMGMVQALILIVVGKIFFKLNLGDFGLSLLVLGAFALAMAALSIFIGSLCTKEDMIIGLAVLLANLFAGLGGCWWPNEIVPLGVRRAAMISPAYWAMDALHKLRFFQGGFGDILPHLGILLALAAILGAVAARAFRVRE